MTMQQEIDELTELLERQPWAATYRLLELSRRWAADSRLEDEAVALKLQFDAAQDATAREVAIAAMADLTRRLAEQHDPEALARREAQEKALALQAYQRPVDRSVVVQATGLRKAYPATQFELAIDALTLRRGEVTGLLGENTTGKTTLFRILAGDLAADADELAYPLFQPEKKSLDWPRLRQHIAYVPQQLPDWQGSLRDNLHQEAALHGLRGEANHAAVRYIVQRLGLQPHLAKRWKQLSGGYKLRFALAKALIWRPSLLILDEPLAFLDVRAQLTVLNDLQQLAKSLQHPIAVLLSAQHVHEVELIADQMLFMRSGQLVHIGQRSTIGAERDFQIFEFATPLSMVALTQRLAQFRYQSLYYTGQAYVIRTSQDVQTTELLQTLLDRDIPVTYFRDISQSLKPYFYETLA